MRVYVALALGAISSVASAQYLLVPDSLNDRVLKLNAFDGSIVDANFITNTAFATPIASIQVGSQIWISDQLNDTVYRYSHTGSLLGTISGQLDNIRGINVVNGQVWVTNSGTANGGQIGIYRYDFAGGLLGSFPLGAGSGSTSPWDVKQFGNEAYVTDSTSDDIDRYDFNGNYLGKFYDSNGTTDLNFPQQLATFNSQIMVSGFSLPDPGVYQFATNGTKVGFHRVSSNLGIRGVYQLGDGNIIATGGTRLAKINTSGTTWTDSDILNQTTPAASFRFVSALNPVPEPASVAALSLGAVALLRRRRK